MMASEITKGHKAQNINSLFLHRLLVIMTDTALGFTSSEGTHLADVTGTGEELSKLLKGKSPHWFTKQNVSKKRCTAYQVPVHSR